MIIRSNVLQGIRDGTITLAFRRWRRPTVRPGGTLLTAIGQLEIARVDAIESEEVSETDARRAGCESRDALLADLAQRGEGRIYRIAFGAVRADPRIALRERQPDAIELTDLVARLRRLDASSAAPWTRQVLELIRSHPAIRAADLCIMAGQERDAFKVNVRKLKRLGLTESLEVGYRLSPRGLAVLKALTSPA